MTNDNYIPRTLLYENKAYSEAELLNSFRYVVVLAEPGGGKTELLGSLAAQLQSKKYSATQFKYRGPSTENTALVLDAFDEISKIGDSNIFELFAKAQSVGAEKIILSSRSSEWDPAYSFRFKEIIGETPTIVRLLAFSGEEQKQLFESHVPEEDFDHFCSEVRRFDLEPLLPNPQFLKLFADAYVESGRHFLDKSSIFEKAIDRLAREVNQSVSQKGAIGLEVKTKLASECFAKLLLSGAEGVTSTDVNPNRLFPRLASLFNESASQDCILETRLFKPGDEVDQHKPVHKIVAEYCAAQYLTFRIIDSVDPLSLSQCLAVIAPNSVVRDELRGMLGWMAALGNESLQVAAINLDPYAVLANGDPTLLLPTSKKTLIHRLKTIAKTDPLFRRADFWRSFSGAGFFSEELVSELKPLLSGKNDHGDLRGLLLELLIGSSATSALIQELRALLLSQDSNDRIRTLASKCLLSLDGYEWQDDISKLMIEGSELSLKLISTITPKVGVETLGDRFVLEYLKACERLYPGRDEQERVLGKRVFINAFVSKQSLPVVLFALDELTRALSCNCKKEVYDCDCRIGVSKIVSLLLDRYFELSDTYDASHIWRWTKSLHFHDQVPSDHGIAVEALQNDDSLRQSIIKIAVEHVTDPDEINRLFWEVLGHYGHSGLTIRPADNRFVVDLAFEAKNIVLWSHFIASHNYYAKKEETKPNELRRHMREQARKDASFMRVWVPRNREIDKFAYKQWRRRLPFKRRSKRRNKQQIETRERNIRYIQKNRKLIESGNHWGSLQHFAELILHRPDQIEVEVGDNSLVNKALMNCFDFISPHVLSVHELAELQCKPKTSTIDIQYVLYAACLLVFRRVGTLDYIQRSFLLALRTYIGPPYEGVSDRERVEFKVEVERVLFPSGEETEEFIRAYIEPLLIAPECSVPQAYWLRSEDQFQPFRETLPIEWFQRFHQLPLWSLHELFEMAAEFGDQDELRVIISDRCQKVMSENPGLTDEEEIEQIRTFWLIRAFYFLPEIPDNYWDWLKADKNTVLKLNEISGGMYGDSHKHWPTLSAHKVEIVLTSFIDQWPEVELPGSWGSESPAGERAYRFLVDLIWKIGDDTPEASLQVLDGLLADIHFENFTESLLSIRAKAVRDKALQEFEAPPPQAIVSLLDKGEVVSVEGLRALLIQEFKDYQADLDGSDTTSKDVFFEKGEHLGEVPATLRIADRMRLRLEGKGITVSVEHQLKDAKRCDFTCSRIISGQRKLLVIEVKGQWHSELYTAAAEQLHQRYSKHPDAEQQGVYLVLWFGVTEKIAGKKNKGVNNANELREGIVNAMSPELRPLIDVFVLDLSRG